MEPTARTSNAAVVSLVAGIVAWLAVPIIGSLVAIVAGHYALDRIRESGGLLTGRRMALAGLALGWIQVAVIAIGFAVWLVMLLFAGAVGGLAVVAVVLLGLAVLATLAMLFKLLFFGFT